MAAPEVWTERMLTALVTGLKGNRRFRLIDRVYRFETLVAAWWYGYFKHSHRTAFEDVDSYVRERLRSILPSREGRRGRGRGNDHQKWRNHYFAKLGLFSLMQAHAETLVSLREGATH